MLLNSLGLSAEEETRVVDAIKGKIASQVPELFLSLDGSYSIDLDYTLLSQNVKSAVARWIRQHLISRLQVYNECDTSDEDFDRQIPTSSRHSSNFMTLEQFQLVRHILEELEDFSILADVLFIVSSGGQGLILTDVTDTVNHYFDIFDAIGAADCLFRSLYQQVRDSCGQELPDKDFLESLMDLACHLSDVDEEVRNLQKEMSAHVSRHSAAAYSPISDNMVEAVQFTTEPTFADEMDQMLASGTSMDKQTLTRVFRTIIDHLETSDRKSTHLTTRFAQLLARLRKFAPKTFNALLRGWLQELPISNPRKEISKITPPLICARVVSLDVVLNNTTLLLSHNGNRDAQATLALDLLAIVTEARSGRMPVVEYRSYRLPNQIKRLLRTSPASVMSIVSVALDACTATNIPLRTRARTQLNSLAVRNLIQILVIMQSRSAIDSRSSFSTNGLQKAFGAGLDCDELGAPPHFGLRIRISKLLETLNDLNVPLAQLELRAILEVSDSGGNAANAIAEAFLDFPKNPTTHYIDLRACLVSELSVSQAASIRERAETEILAWVVRNIAFGSKEGLTAAIEAWVSIVEAAAFSVRTETSPLIHQISDYLLAIGAMPPEDKDRLDRGIDTNDVFHFISVLLRILTIHQSTFQHQKNSQSTLLQVLVSLGLLLIHPLLHSNPTLAGFVFDTLNLFSDFATHETRSRCISTLREHPGARDPRLQFIFGYSEIVDGEWLQVSIQSSSIGDSKIEGATTPYPLRRWEMVQDATPITTENDTSLSLIFFGARKSVL